MAFDGTTLYFLSNDNGRLYELNPATGAVLDSTVLGSDPYSGLAALGGKAYVLKHTDADVLVFDPVTNSVTGTKDMDAINNGLTMKGLSESVSTGELVSIVAGNSYIGFFNATTGVRTGSFGIANGISAESVQAIGDEVYVGYATRIDVHSRATGAVTRSFNLGFAPRELAAVGDTERRTPRDAGRGPGGNKR